jgi:hypothetical protein
MITLLCVLGSRVHARLAKTRSVTRQIEQRRLSCFPVFNFQHAFIENETFVKRQAATVL